MSAETAIRVQNVSKAFKLPHEKTSSVKSVVLNFYKRKKGYELQQALDNVSFEIKKGEFFGIVGRNGSGKSTLLKLLAGIYSPSKGRIQVNGKLTPFIELGVGFNPELTGRENVYLNGALLGFSQKEMEAMYDEIVAFAEIEKFMDQKLKNYSSGMQVRLAFSIAIQAKSDILLIDEVLAVGDDNFQRKCFETFESLKREGRTIVFVSHSMASVRDFCDRALLLSNGKIVELGDVETIVEKYNELNQAGEVNRLVGENSGKIKAADSDVREVLGNKKVEIMGCTIFDHTGKESPNIESGKSFTIKFPATFKAKIEHPAYGVMFRKNPKENLFGINSFFGKKQLPPQAAGSRVLVEASAVMPLAPGTYYLTIAISNQKNRSDYVDLLVLNNYLKVSVHGSETTWGLIPNEGQFKIHNSRN